MSVTHVVMARGSGARARDAIVLGKQLFATHYVNGSLNVTAVVGGDRSPARYLVILNRTNVDLLGGFFAGLTRYSIERRLKSEWSAILEHLARRLESGPPRSTSAGRGRTARRVEQGDDIG